MADKKVVSIDLGREVVKFAFAQVSKGSVKLTGCQSVTLEIAHDADDSAWRAAVLEVLKQQKAAGSLDKKSEIYVTLPSAQVLTRALKVPTAELQTQVVEEAKKNLPLPIEEAEWSYNVVGEAGDQSHVSLLAVKSSVVEDINAIFEEAGLSLAGATSGALNIADLLIAEGKGSVETPTAVLSIGASSANLVIAEGKKVWMRALPVFGSTLVSALTAGGASFDEARKTLLEQVDLGNAESESTKAVGQALSRLVMEITRSIVNYRTSLSGEKPAKLLLTGGYAKIKGLDAYLQDKLKTDTAYLDAFASFEGESGDSFAFAEALGALTAIAGTSPYSVNLVPANLQWQRSFDGKKPLIIAAVALLAVLFGALFILNQGKISKEQAEAEKAQETLETAQKYDKAIKQVQKNIQTQLADNEVYGRLLWERDAYVYTISQLAAKMPTNMWLYGVRSFTLGDISEENAMSSNASDILVINNEEDAKTLVRIGIDCGYYGNWAEAMPEIQKLVADTVGNAGFKVGRDLPWLKYTELQMVVDLDWNNNGKDDFSEYKEKFSVKSGR
ncbi:pilus assembly protein PilM [bacterium]|nr:pilus assembly protein PilM [bacterium]